MVLKFEYNNTIFYLGENAQDNWNLLSKNKNFIWLHLNSFSSGHCVIESDDIKDKKLINYGSLLVKNGSKYKDMKNLKVIYTQLKNVTKGSNIGEVNIKGKCKFITI
jgi:hypothetical protein